MTNYHYLIYTDPYYRTQSGRVAPSKKEVPGSTNLIYVGWNDRSHYLLQLASQSGFQIVLQTLVLSLGNFWCR